MKPPETVFRYEAPTQRSLDNLEKQIVFYASPMQFNDPFDCALGMTLIEPTEVTDDDVNHIRDSELFNSSCKKLNRVPIKYWKNSQIAEVARTGFKMLIENARVERGIVCFTETNSNLLMWSHYGSSHTGWCLEFATDLEPFDRLHKVKYEIAFPAPNVRSVIQRRTGYEECMTEVYCTKSKDWHYEQEWRAIHENPRVEHRYEAQSLRAIYFGALCSEETMIKVRKILATRDDAITLWKGRRSDTEFKIEFDQISL